MKIPHIQIWWERSAVQLRVRLGPANVCLWPSRTAIERFYVWAEKWFKLDDRKPKSFCPIKDCQGPSSGWKRLMSSVTPELAKERMAVNRTSKRHRTRGSIRNFIFWHCTWSSNSTRQIIVFSLLCNTLHPAEDTLHSNHLYLPSTEVSYL